MFPSLLHLTTFLQSTVAQQSSDNVIIYDEDDIVVKTSNSDSLFDVRLKEKWLFAQTKNVFRYVLTEGSVESKIIDGSYKFVAEFNANRGLLRRKPQNAIAVKMPFNGNNFNFTKVSADETLFKFRIGSDGEEVSILINNSPIEFASSLMVPSVEKCLPQVLTEESIFYAIFLSSLSGHNSFRMGFNSLGAAASVNQLHWHLYYLDFDLEVESTLIVDNQLLNWPAAGFAFEIEEFNLSSFREVATKVFKIVDYCFEIELPHNLFITRTRDGSRLRILLWPREAEFGVKNDMEITAALCEFSGFFICKTREMYDTITEEFCLKAMSSLDTKIKLLSEKFSHL
ncbi:GDP-D-glucose phosphorylase 1 [Halotydeus destructor]|nr:GDP-D-glucose phosphorylase 1 [Halotydeus destructor]